jgi:hypothetical protein
VRFNEKAANQSAIVTNFGPCFQRSRSYAPGGSDLLVLQCCDALPTDSKNDEEQHFHCDRSKRFPEQHDALEVHIDWKTKGHDRMWAQ